MKILLGGVPFGCNNVGDEAILECSVRLLERLCPGAALTVSTNNPAETADKLRIRTCPLFGFPPPYSRREMLEALREHDAFIWCGATGLSDYPEIPLAMMQAARHAGKKTILWSVGMNSELNPAKYSVLPGKRRMLLSALGALTFGTVDAVRLEEQRRERRVRRLIREQVNAADLVIVRDSESRAELERCGVQRHIAVGADPALLLKPVDLDRVRLNDKIRQFLNADFHKVGVGISTAAPVFERPEELAQCLDRLVADGRTRILFVPMDPLTDAGFMTEVRARMTHSQHTELLAGHYEPAEILAVISRLRVVVSSRLHLLILSSLADVPFVGISPGSKVDSFLHAHDLKPVGTAAACDFNSLEHEARRLLQDGGQCVERIHRTRQILLKRLEEASLRLQTALDPVVNG